MRLLIILSILTLAACAKNESSSPALAASFVPKTCSFVATEAADPRYASGSVDKYACTSELANMNCFAYAQGEAALYVQCSLKSASIPQGVPEGCTLNNSNGGHEFLDGLNLSSIVYDCGTENDNLRCFYFSALSHEEVRCNLL